MSNRSTPKREATPAGKISTGQSTNSTRRQSGKPIDAKGRAEKLLEQAGALELAAHAADRSPGSPGKGSPQDQFARQLGFASYLSLFEDSTLVSANEGKQWFVTAIGNREWILWNDSDLVVLDTYPSREAAEKGVDSGK